MIWTPHAVAATIVEKDGKFLLVEEVVDGKTVYNQPAGHVDEDESILVAARRETLEETAWRVEITDLIGIYTLKSEKPGITYYRFCFAAAPLEQTDNPLDHGIVGPRWFTLEEVRALGPQLRSPLVVRCIEDYLAGKRFPLDLIYEHPVG